eukprot:TRINITY_DN5020_c0_g1_i1.p1 TRINITY_DN5020_c0_g1~~TRINITY_DN5020_c0_g1_i1.p1  ORF type:complete len:956 (-),score=163.86 TRINITY_DN5020_c0_g1_i1:2655-5522(-)
MSTSSYFIFPPQTNVLLNSGDWLDLVYNPALLDQYCQGVLEGNEVSLSPQQLLQQIVYQFNSTLPTNLKRRQFLFGFIAKVCSKLRVSIFDIETVFDLHDQGRIYYDMMCFYDEGSSERKMNHMHLHRWALRIECQGEKPILKVPVVPQSTGAAGSTTPMPQTPGYDTPREPYDEPCVVIAFEDAIGNLERMFEENICIIPNDLAFVFAVEMSKYYLQSSLYDRSYLWCERAVEFRSQVSDSCEVDRLIKAEEVDALLQLCKSISTQRKITQDCLFSQDEQVLCFPQTTDVKSWEEFLDTYIDWVIGGKLSAADQETAASAPLFEKSTDFVIMKQKILIVNMMGKVLRKEYISGVHIEGLKLYDPANASILSSVATKMGHLIQANITCCSSDEAAVRGWVEKESSLQHLLKKIASSYQLEAASNLKRKAHDTDQPQVQVKKAKLFELPTTIDFTLRSPYLILRNCQTPHQLAEFLASLRIRNASAEHQGMAISVLVEALSSQFRRGSDFEALPMVKALMFEFPACLDISVVQLKALCHDLKWHSLNPRTAVDEFVSHLRNHGAISIEILTSFYARLFDKGAWEEVDAVTHAVLRSLQHHGERSQDVVALSQFASAFSKHFQASDRILPDNPTRDQALLYFHQICQTFTELMNYIQPAKQKGQKEHFAIKWNPEGGLLSAIESLSVLSQFASHLAHYLYRIRLENPKCNIRISTSKYGVFSKSNIVQAFPEMAFQNFSTTNTVVTASIENGVFVLLSATISRLCRLEPSNARWYYCMGDLHIERTRMPESVSYYLAGMALETDWFTKSSIPPSIQIDATEREERNSKHDMIERIAAGLRAIKASFHASMLQLLHPKPKYDIIFKGVRAGLPTLDHEYLKNIWDTHVVEQLINELLNTSQDAEKLSILYSIISNPKMGLPSFQAQRDLYIHNMQANYFRLLSKEFEDRIMKAIQEMR